MCRGISCSELDMSSHMCTAAAFYTWPTSLCSLFCGTSLGPLHNAYCFMICSVPAPAAVSAGDAGANG
eukprot:1158770-Pelagomonas_calceolata.AAC.3